MAHRTLAATARHAETIKGSRFSATVAPLGRPEEAEDWIARVRAEEREARHVAWAWRWGATVRWSDDGEPGGTAGRPMLEVLVKRDVDRAVALVARVFGGVKLGAGGLVRAYGGAVAQALDAARIVEVPDRRGFTLRAPFAEADVLLRLLADDAVEHEAPGFDAAGLTLTGTVLASAVEALERRAAELTRGRAMWSWGAVADPSDAGRADQRK